MEIETRCPYCGVPYPLDMKKQKWKFNEDYWDWGTDVQCKNCNKVFGIALPGEYVNKIDEKNKIPLSAF